MQDDDLFATGGGLDALQRVADSNDKARLGQNVGRFVLIDLLGSGGMGHVYRAQPSEGGLSRDVAIKCIRGGLTELSQSRFKREAEIHSRLAHPNIARLYDAQVTDDESFLVMELVEGVPLDVYCATEDVTLKGRVHLLLQVGRAVAYAHSNLVIHRDIKPSNILVSDDGVPKLLDFGVAKLLDENGGDLTADARILTPKYASPEQILGAQITTQSDVFQLGALLLTVVAGQPPFPDATLSGALARASKDADASVDPVTLRALPPELQAVVRKCLSADPEFRYSSAAALCDDLERFLGNFPVLAREPSWLERAAKLVRRQPWPTALVSALIVLILIGNFVYLDRLNRNRVAAELAADKATAVTNFLVELFERASPDAQSGDELSVRTLIDQGDELIRDRLAGQPEVLTELQHTLGRIYLSIEAFDRSERLLNQALEGRRKLYGESSPEVAQSYGFLGRLAYEQVGEQAKARELFQRALSLPVPDASSRLDRAILLADFATYLIVVEQNFEHAIQRLEEARSIQNKLLPNNHIDRIQVMRQLMIAHERLANYELAQGIGERILTMAELLTNAQHASLIDPLYSLGRVHESQGRYEEAGRSFSRALEISRATYGDASSRTGNVALNLAHIQRLTGELNDAQTMSKLALDAIRKVYGTQGTDMAVALAVAGSIQRELGNYAQAEAWLSEALELYRQAFGDSHTHTGYGAMMLAHLYREDGRWFEALALYWQAHDNWLAVVGPDHPDSAKVKLYLADIYTRIKELQRARELLTVAQAVNTKALADDHDRIAEGKILEGALLRAEGRSDACAEPITKGLASRMQRLNDGHRLIALARIELGHCLNAQGYPEQASSLFTQALADLPNHPALVARELRASR